MAQGRSTKVISMIKWVRTSRLSVKNSLSLAPMCLGFGGSRLGLGLGVRVWRAFGFGFWGLKVQSGVIVKKLAFRMQS